MEFTRHAIRRMRLRGVSKVEVLEALLSRQETRPSDEYPNRSIVIGTTSAGRRLKIILSSDEQTVITVAAQGQRR